MFSWLKNYSRINTRWEYKAENYLDVLHLGSILLLLKRFVSEIGSRHALYDTLEVESAFGFVDQTETQWYDFIRSAVSSELVTFRK